MCLYPKLIANRKWIPNKKNGGNPPICKDERTQFVAVGCGKCMECRKQKSRGWSVRLQEEIRTDTKGVFVTLTFSTESLLELAKDIEVEGYERDNQICIKATRLFLERWRKRTGKSVKHWLITELGHGRTEHVHMHGIIFTSEREWIEKTWKYGFVYVGKYVNSKTVNYCVKYMTKVDAEHKFYIPKVLSSKGIGSNYTNRSEVIKNRFRGENTEETYRVPNGKKLNLPVYYRNKIYTEEEREELWIQKLDKGERWVDGIKAESMEHYWQLLKQARDKNRRLGYGNDEKDWNRIRYENQLRDLKFKERISKIREKLNYDDMDNN